MKSILVPVEEHRLIQPVLETALLLGRALNGYLEGMAITPNLPPYIASDLAIGDISFLDPEVRRQRAEASQRFFETFMTAQGAARSEAGSSGLCFGWGGVIWRRTTSSATTHEPSTSPCSGAQAMSLMSRACQRSRRRCSKAAARCCSCHQPGLPLWARPW